MPQRLRRPRPRLAFGRGIAGRVHACADVSDGLIADLAHICRASSVTAVLERDRVPLSAAARAAVELRPELWSTILGGGDDYELVFTAAADDAASIRQAADRAGTSVSRIGSVEEATNLGAISAPVVVSGDDGRPLALHISGWRYFRDT